MTPAMKILVIEDDKELLFALKTILSIEGYDVETADNLPEGKAKISENTYDLVITDIMLPHWGGFDLVDAVKESETRSKTPVLVITGMDEDILNTTRTYAEKCLTKPFNKQHLLSAVDELLQK
jgi:DNA-binding response OmpR family regulator